MIKWFRIVFRNAIDIFKIIKSVHIFKNVTLTIVQDGDNWMLSREPLTDNQSVEDETTTHFNISH